MKTKNLMIAGLVLVLLNACQTKQTLNKDPVVDPNTTAATATGASNKVSVSHVVDKLEAAMYNDEGVLVEFNVVASDADYVATMTKVGKEDKKVEAKINATANTKIFQAVDSLFLGTLKIKESTDGKHTSGIKITMKNAKVAEIKNPVFEGANSETLLADLLKLLLDEQYASENPDEAKSGATDKTSEKDSSDADGNVKARIETDDVAADATTCETLNLAGNWTADIVTNNGAASYTSSIVADGKSGNLQAFKGTDSSGSNTQSVSYRYEARSCILEKTVASQKPAYSKIMYFGGGSRDLLKVIPCDDQTCRNVDARPAYTDMVVLKRN